MARFLQSYRICKSAGMKGYVLVTGASAGIGTVFAEEVARLGYSGIILAARRLERLSELKAKLVDSGYRGEIILAPCDLRDRKAREQLHQLAAKYDLELLINNAGFGYVGSFLSEESDNILEMVEVNCSAPLHLARLFAPGLIKRGAGGIINVASIAAYPPLPFMATYGATKALLLNWSVAFREELRGTGVAVLALCPGPTVSDFHLVAGVKEKISVVPAMDTLTVVREAFAALESGQAVKINGWKNFLIAELTRLFPRGVVSRIGRALIETRVPVERRK